MTHHFSDREIKAVFGRSEGNYRDILRPYHPDWVSVVGYKVYIVEYENSSRGLISHVAKYLKVASERRDCQFHIKLIRSLHHQETHDLDHRLAEYLVNFRTENIEFKFVDCDGTVETLLRLRDFTPLN